MKMLFKKAICLLSSEILLCGASAIPASAARNYELGQNLTLDHSLEVSNPSTITAIVVHSDFELNKSYDEITSSETTVLEVVKYKTLLGYELSYQWFKGTTAISGATSKTYSVSEPGEYFCKITAEPRFIEKAGSRKADSIAIAENTRVKVSESSFKRAVTTTAPQISVLQTFETNKATIKRVSDVAISSQPKNGVINSDSGYYTLSIGVKGGTAPYSFAWMKKGSANILSTQQNYNADKAGDYYCVVTDSKGRKAESASATVSWSELEFKTAPSYSYYLNDTNNRITISTEAKGSTGNYSIEWQKYDPTRYYGGYPIYAGWHTYKYGRSIDVSLNDEFDYGEYRNGRAYYYGRGEYFTGYYYADLYVYNDYRCIIRSLDENGNIVGEKIKEFKVYKLSQKDVEINYSTYARIMGYMY